MSDLGQLPHESCVRVLSYVLPCVFSINAEIRMRNMFSRRRSEVLWFQRFRTHVLSHRVTMGQLPVGSTQVATLGQLFHLESVSKDIHATVHDPHVWRGRVLDLSRGDIRGGQFRQLGHILRLAAKVRVNTHQASWLQSRFSFC